MTLDAATASRLARLTLGQLAREWPYRMDQVLTGPEDLATPAALHPVFHGSYDWHSCVHGWWHVSRLARLFPNAPEAPRVEALADCRLTAGGQALAYLRRSTAAASSAPTAGRGSWPRTESWR